MAAALRVFGMVFALALTSAEAEAGPLGKVVGGLKQRSGQSGGGGSGGSPETTRDHRSDQDSDSSSDDSDSESSSDSSHWGGGHRPHRTHMRTSFFAGGYPYPTNNAGTDVRVYVGVLSVEESDGAAAVSLRASYGPIGIELDDTSFYERDETSLRNEFITLDVWSLNLAYRAVATGPEERTAVWLKAGLAGANSDGLGIFGAVVGAEVAHNFTSAVGVEGSARVFNYQDGIRALELRTGVAASFVRLSYRVLKFNVGPALRGPEVGVSLSF